MLKSEFPPYGQSVHRYIFSEKDFEASDPSSLEERIATYCKEHDLNAGMDYSKALRQMIVAGMVQDL